MPKRGLSRESGTIFHVFNRGNHRQTLFHSPADFDAFTGIVRQAERRFGVEILAYIVMPNHWHFVLRPLRDGEMSAYVGWFSMTHASRWKRVYGTVGPVYQGRFKAFPVADDQYLFTLLLYVERNALRAGLVADAREWPWGSAYASGDSPALRLAPSPIPRPANWGEILNLVGVEADLARVRHCVQTSRPLGNDAWTKAIARQLGWKTGLLPVGRPARNRITPPHPTDAAPPQILCVPSSGLGAKEPPM